MAQHLGVCYVYEDLSQPEEPTGTDQQQYDVSRADLTVLPTDWVAKLHTVAKRARGKACLALITEIEAKHPRLARALTRWVNEFRFDKLIAVTKPDEQ